MTRQTIRWTDDERAFLVDGASDLMLQAYIAGTQLTWVSAVVQVQEIVLSEGRTRSRASLYLDTRLRNLVTKTFEEKRAHADKDRLSVLTKDSSEELQKSEESLKQSPDPLSALVENLLGVFAGKVADLLVEQIATRVSDLVLEKVRANLASEKHDPSPATHETEQPSVSQPVPQKPKVLVVGTIPAQQRIIEEGWSEVIDLKFVPSYGKSTRVNDLAKNVDQIFVLTKFVPHSMTIDLPRDRCQLVHGGIKQLGDSIGTWWSEST